MPPVALPGKEAGYLGEYRRSIIARDEAGAATSALDVAGAAWCWWRLLPGGSDRAHDRRDLWYQIGRSSVLYTDDMFPLQRTGTHLVINEGYVF
jgi:hypothetical protein